MRDQQVQVGVEGEIVFVAGLELQQRVEFLRAAGYFCRSISTTGVVQACGPIIRWSAQHRFEESFCFIECRALVRDPRQQPQGLYVLTSIHEIGADALEHAPTRRQRRIDTHSAQERLGRAGRIAKGHIAVTAFLKESAEPRMT